MKAFLLCVACLALLSPMGVRAGCEGKAIDAVEAAKKETKFDAVVAKLEGVPAMLKDCKLVKDPKTMSPEGEALWKKMKDFSEHVRKTFAKEYAADNDQFINATRAIKSKKGAPKKMMFLEVRRRVNIKHRTSSLIVHRNTQIRALLARIWAAIVAFFAPAPPPPPVAVAAAAPAGPAPILFTAAAHCPVPAAIFAGCPSAPHRAFAQNAANCNHPMVPNMGAGGAPAAAGYDWNNNGGPPIPRAPNAYTVIGFGGDINMQTAAPPNFGQAENLNKLALWGWGVHYDHCVNLQWTWCAAHGLLPNQGGAHFVLSTAPGQIDMNPLTNGGHGYSTTNDEFCALTHFCANGAALFAAPVTPLAPWVAGTPVGPPNTWTCVPTPAVI